MNKFRFSKYLKSTAIVFASVLALSACSDSDSPAETMTADTMVRYIVPLTPAQEVPPVTSATATGEGNLVVDTATGALSGSVAVSGLSGPATMAHIHEAPEGENGSAIITLEGNADGSVWSVPADTVLDTPQLAALTAGNLYFNVHTDANQGGELRGQIRLAAETPATEVTQLVPLSPAQEVPPVTSATATGEGNIVIDTVSGALSGSVTVSGLSGQASMAHVHQAPAGENGSIIITLEGNADGTVWSVPADTVLDTDQLTALNASNLYFNVHTDANQGGELRGQIILATGVSL